MSVANLVFKKVDWRIFMAMGITALWLGYWIYYLSVSVGWVSFLNKPIESLGSFLEGAFAPLAFLWLVVGYFLQQHELSRNTDAINQQHIEMSKSLEHAAIQSRSLEESSCYTQQQTFIQTYALVRETLGSVAGMLFISSQGESGNGSLNLEDLSALWSRAATGDPETFSRQLLGLNIRNEQNISDLLFGTEIRDRHSRNFMRQFRRLIDQADKCDSQGMLSEAVRTSAHGLLYNLMEEHIDASLTAANNLSQVEHK